MDYFYPYLVAVIGGLLGLVFLYNRHNTIESKLLAQEVSGGLPIIGHLHQLGAQQSVFRTLAAMADKYGPVFRIRLGMIPTLVVCNHEAVKDCLTTNDKILASRPKLNAAKYLGYDHASFIFSPYGAYWREIRKLVVLKLLSNQRLATLKHVQTSEINALIKSLYLFCKKNDHSPNQKILIGEMFEVLTLNIILRAIAGNRYSSTGADGDEEDKKARRIMKLFQKVSYLFSVNTISEIVPFLKWMDRWSWQVKSMKNVAKELDDLIGSWVDEHKSKRLESGRNYEDQDFIDVMLSTIKDDTMFGYTRETVIKATSMTLIGAGSETTAITLTWILSNLMNNRQALKQAQEELDVKIGRDRWVQDSDVERLVYMEAIIKETLRLYPAGPIAVHEAMEDCRVNNYHIPKGTRILLHIWKVQRDPRVWSNPEEFRPERFLTSHKKVDVLGQNFELIPFSSGRRSCPGATLAMQVIRLTFARLLQGFEITTPLNAPVDMTEKPSSDLVKAIPLEVVLTPRLPDHLYQL